jgi:hypothetical protein
MLNVQHHLIVKTIKTLNMTEFNFLERSAYTKLTMFLKEVKTFTHGSHCTSQQSIEKEFDQHLFSALHSEG